MKKTMKNLLVALLSFVLVFSLCACGGNSTDGTENNADVGNEEENSTQSSDNGSDNEDDASAEQAEPTFIGTWVHERTEAEPFKMTIVINEDGTATSGGSEFVWYEDDDEDAKEGAIEIASPDAVGYGDDAYLTEDGKLCWEREFSLVQDGETYEKIVFVKQ